MNHAVNIHIPYMWQICIFIDAFEGVLGTDSQFYVSMTTDYVLVRSLERSHTYAWVGNLQHAEENTSRLVSKWRWVKTYDFHQF